MLTVDEESDASRSLGFPIDIEQRKSGQPLLDSNDADKSEWKGEFKPTDNLT